tara:strand:- start:74 stop:508 length:435 start_codon:yes stop_codon:yes gene_type:complete
MIASADPSFAPKQLMSEPVTDADAGEALSDIMIVSVKLPHPFASAALIEYVSPHRSFLIESLYPFVQMNVYGCIPPDKDIEIFPLQTVLSHDVLLEDVVEMLTMLGSFIVYVAEAISPHTRSTISRLYVPGSRFVWLEIGGKKG